MIVEITSTLEQFSIQLTITAWDLGGDLGGDIGGHLGGDIDLITVLKLYTQAVCDHACGIFLIDFNCSMLIVQPFV